MVRENHIQVEHLPPPYAPLAPLGEGGEGQAWLAWDPSLQRQVVCKRLSKRLRRKPTGEPRSSTSQDPMHRLTQLHQAPHVYGLVCHRGQEWLILEYLDGHDLGRATAAERRRWGPVVQFGFAVELLDLLLDLRGVGLVHGDLSPGNVLVDHSGALRTIDCLQADLPGAKRTHRGAAGFFNPANVGDRLSYKDDQYAVGCLIFWLLGVPGPQYVQDETGKLLCLSPSMPATVPVACADLWSLAVALTSDRTWSETALVDRVQKLKWQRRGMPTSEEEAMVTPGAEMGRPVSALSGGAGQGERRQNATLLAPRPRRRRSLVGLLAIVVAALTVSFHPRPKLVIDVRNLQIMANTPLPAGFNRDWLVRSVTEEFNRLGYPGGRESGHWLLDVTCDYQRCVLALEMPVPSGKTAIQRSFPSTADARQWSRVVSSLALDAAGR